MFESVCVCICKGDVDGERQLLKPSRLASALQQEKQFWW